MQKKENRGAKKGRIITWEVGRKATGRERDKTISFKVTEKEREYMYKVLDKIGDTRTDSFLKLLKKYEEEIK